MAKWGEGDPRWIVEKRPDAHNVNNWHWRESNATQWSKDKLKKLLVGLKIEDDEVGSCEITAIKSCDGEASVSNRKKKIIRFFEFNVKLKWKGKIKNGDIVYKGEAEIPNLSEENEPDEMDVNVTWPKDEPQCDILRHLMTTLGTVLIRNKLGIYIEALVKEYSQTLILPTKDTETSTTTNKTSVQKQTSSVDLKSDGMGKLSLNGSKPASKGVKIETKMLKMSETFMTTIDELFKTLTKKDRVSVWSRSSVKNDASPGIEFNFFDGNVHGEYTDIDENKKVGMKWRLKSWPDAHFSQVVFTFEQSVDGAKLFLEQTGVPKDAIEKTTEGWKRYYFHEIKMCFGYGSIG